MKYVINAQGHYFEIEEGICLEVLVENNCRVFTTKGQMYEAVIDMTGLQFDEVEGTELYVGNCDQYDHQLGEEIPPEQHIIDYTE